MSEEYQATFTVAVSKSPLRDGWYGRVLISEDELLDTQLTGFGTTALQAAQRALGSLTVDTAYVNAILEAALLRGTRLAGDRKPKAELSDGGRKHGRARR